MSKDINFEPPGIEALDPPTSVEIDDIIGQVDPAKAGHREVRDALFAAIVEYRLEGDWQSAPNQSDLQNRLESIRKCAQRLNELMRPHYVDQTLTDLIGDFNESRKAGEKLEIVQLQEYLRLLVAAIDTSEPQTADRSTPQSRLAEKISAVYKALRGRPLVIHGDEYSDSGVKDEASLRFARKALEVAGIKNKSDTAIRSMFRRI